MFRADTAIAESRERTARARRIHAGLYFVRLQRQAGPEWPGVNCPRPLQDFCLRSGTLLYHSVGLASAREDGPRQEVSECGAGRCAIGSGLSIPLRVPSARWTST